MYNASNVIEETLKRLSDMEKIPYLPWEVLIINNNSTDDSVSKALKTWEPVAELRIINEHKQGTGYAKFRGMLEAKYSYIGFVDQDNWMNPDWMVKSVGHLEASTKAAMVCGKGEPVFEIEVPAWFNRFKQNYAVGSQATSNGANHDINRFFYTAGSIMRKAAFDDLVDLGFSPILKSRSGQILLSGEDTELQILFRLRGWEIHYQDDICFEHYMSSKRLSLDYFRRFRRGLGATSVYLDLYRSALKSQTEQTQTPMADWVKLLLKSLFYVLTDPLAIAASFIPKYASNFRVAKYWSRSGEFRERLRLRSTLKTTQSKLFNWLESVVYQAQKPSAIFTQTP